MTHYALLIDGKLHTTEHADAVLDPATEQTVGYAARASHAQVDTAVKAAQRAFASWAANPQARRHALAQAASVLRENTQPLAELISREQGRPLRFTLGEVAGAAATFDHYASFEAPAAEVLRDDEQRLVRLERRPLGVVAAITPWNVPIILLVLKLAPALHAGNTLVAKP